MNTTLALLAPDIRSWIEYLLGLLQKWTQSIYNPKQFLAPLFQPNDSQVLDGLEFYFWIIVLNLLIYSPFLLGSKSELAEKIRLLAFVVVGQVFGMVIVLTWHLAFWLMGGGASFAGTYLVSVYAGAPYMLLVSASSLILVGALPPELRPLAINPVTSQTALQRGLADPRTNNVAVVCGGLLTWIITIWMTVVLFKCMSFVHSLTGWRLVLAIVISLLISIISLPAMKFIVSIFLPTPVIPPANQAPEP